MGDNVVVKLAVREKTRGDTVTTKRVREMKIKSRIFIIQFGVCFVHRPLLLKHC